MSTRSAGDFMQCPTRTPSIRPIKSASTAASGVSGCAMLPCSPESAGPRTYPTGRKVVSYPTCRTRSSSPRPFSARWKSCSGICTTRFGTRSSGAGRRPVSSSVMNNTPSPKPIELPENFLAYLPVLSDTEIKLYLCLMDKQRFTNNLISLRTYALSKELGITVATIHRALRRLESLKLVQRLPQKAQLWQTRVQICRPAQPSARAPHDSKKGKSIERLEAPLPDTDIQRDLLVRDIEATLLDHSHTSLFRTLCWTHSESIIRRALSETRQTPDSKIKRSKIALFLYLIRKYAKLEKNSVS